MRIPEGRTSPSWVAESTLVFAIGSVLALCGFLLVTRFTWDLAISETLVGFIVAEAIVLRRVPAESRYLLARAAGLLFGGALAMAAFVMFGPLFIGVTVALYCAACLIAAWSRWWPDSRTRLWTVACLTALVPLTVLAFYAAAAFTDLPTEPIEVLGFMALTAIVTSLAASARRREASPDAVESAAPRRT
jgi:uncharacterized membrane protein (UPF0136 family)